MSASKAYIIQKIPYMLQKIKHTFELGWVNLQ